MDKRAFVVGVLGGLLFSNVLAWTYYGPWWTVLQKSYGTRWPSDFLLICGVLGCLVMPGLVSALARNHPFAWGVLPLVVFWLSFAAVHTVELGQASITQVIPQIVEVSGACLLLSSGSVTLIRLVSEKRRQATEEKAYWKQRTAGSDPQAEVWPPPPTDTEN